MSKKLENSKSSFEKPYYLNTNFAPLHSGPAGSASWRTRLPAGRQVRNHFNPESIGFNKLLEESQNVPDRKIPDKGE